MIGCANELSNFFAITGKGKTQRLVDTGVVNSEDSKLFLNKAYEKIGGDVSLVSAFITSDGTINVKGKGSLKCIMHIVADQKVTISREIYKSVNLGKYSDKRIFIELTSAQFDEKVSISHHASAIEECLNKPKRNLRDSFDFRADTNLALAINNLHGNGSTYVIEVDANKPALYSVFTGQDAEKTASIFNKFTMAEAKGDVTPIKAKVAKMVKPSQHTPPLKSQTSLTHMDLVALSMANGGINQNAIMRKLLKTNTTNQGVDYAK